jgi:formate hydrogenlyase subunit 4
VTVALSLVAQILHIGLMIVAAPTFAGLTNWFDGRLSGRSGAPVLAPWRDLTRLSRKTTSTTESVSVIARFAPATALGITFAVAALVPSFTLGMALSPLADTLIIVSLLTVARVAIALAALDSGAPLPGLTQQGASALAVLAEPALMLAMLALALMGGSFNLDVIIGQQREGVLLPAAASAMTLATLLALLLADIGVPDWGVPDWGVPDWTTSQTFGGIGLAMVQTATWLRRLIWCDLIGAVFLPVGIGSADSASTTWLIGLAAWIIKLVCAGLALSAFRTILGQVPRNNVADLIGIAMLLALLAVIMVLANAGMA